MPALDLDRVSGDLRATIAAHPDTPADTLRSLAGDEHLHQFLFVNPSSPADMLIEVLDEFTPAELVEILHTGTADVTIDVLTKSLSGLGAADLALLARKLEQVAAAPTSALDRFAEVLTSRLDEPDEAVRRQVLDALNSVLHWPTRANNVTAVTIADAYRQVLVTANDQDRDGLERFLLLSAFNDRTRVNNNLDPVLSPAMILDMWDIAAGNEEIRFALGGLDNCPGELVVELADLVRDRVVGADRVEDRHAEVLNALGILARDEIDGERLVAIAAGGDETNIEFRVAHASNPHCSPSMLDTYSRDQNAEVRRAAAHNPHTPAPVLIEMANRNVSHIQATALRRVEVAASYGYPAGNGYERWCRAIDEGGYAGTAAKLARVLDRAAQNAAANLGQ